MLEALLNNAGNDLHPDYLFYIDFVKAVIGAKTITDRAHGVNMIPAGNTTGTGFGVVDVAGVGRCFKFDGAGYFYNVPSPLNDFSKGSYDFEIGFVKPNLAFQILFATGCSTVYKENGWSLILDQTPAPFQPLQIYQYPTTTRQYFNGVNTQQFIELVIEKRAAETRLINKTTGVTTVVASISQYSDTYLSIGAEHGASYPFSGYLKYLRIKKVIE